MAIEDGWQRTFGIKKTPRTLMVEYLDSLRQRPSNVRPEPDHPLVERYGSDARRVPRYIGVNKKK